MPARHLVTGLDTTLDSQVYLDDLQYARGKVVAALQFTFLVLEPIFEQLALQVAAGALMAACWYVVLHFSVVVANSKPLLAVSFVMLAAAGFFASHLLPSLLQRRSVALKEYG